MKKLTLIALFLFVRFILSPKLIIRCLEEMVILEVLNSFVTQQCR
jgi:hypothetical protein